MRTSELGAQRVSGRGGSGPSQVPTGQQFVGEQEFATVVAALTTHRKAGRNAVLVLERR
jgi:hypothetical protein